VNNEFKQCIKDRHLLSINASKEMIQKELDSAEFDVERSKDSTADEDYKWATIQAYYSMFHAAKALVLQKGFREKSHYCLIVALKELYVKKGLLSSETVENIELCLRLRHDADYGLIYEKDSAEIAIHYAESFLLKAKKLL
jgi:uncharacterized protein (UPF0332 family)